MKRGIGLALGSTLLAAIGFGFFTSEASAVASCGAEGGVSTANPCNFQGVTFTLSAITPTELEITLAPTTGTSLKNSFTTDWTSAITALAAFAVIPGDTSDNFTGATATSTTINGTSTNWVTFTGTVNAGGCDSSMAAGACFAAGTGTPASFTAAPLALPATGNIVLDVTFTGTNSNFTFAPTTHLKVEWVDSTGTKVGSLMSISIPVPGPIVGAGMPGLVIACGGLVALARRRRQKIV
jgi:hypothetical protein